jgi:uncharacterized protein (UPF0261 family)
MAEGPWRVPEGEAPLGGDRPLRIYIVGTADTKGEELAHIAGLVRELGAVPYVVDVGIRAATIPVDVTSRQVAAAGAEQPDALFAGNDRGTAVSAMARAFERFMTGRDDVAGVIGIGGSGGTSIVTAGMRRLPIGLPKIMISTMASGDVGPYVGVSDIMMMPSVTDMAGLNRISRVIFRHAAEAMVAMTARPPAIAGGKPALGLTMFGVTTPAVTRIAERLSGDYETLVFHATGVGGQTMEALVDSGLLSGVLDITTTEIGDLLFGGVLPALPGRLDCIARTRIPYVGSFGACDMVNFGAPDTVPQRHAGRRFYRHNPSVTLMRTTPDECRAVGEWIGGKLDLCEGPIRFLIPEKGVSALDIEGGAFWDPEADAELFEAIERTVRWSGNRKLIRLPHHINDPQFADAAVAAFREIMS